MRKLAIGLLTATGLAATGVLRQALPCQCRQARKAYWVGAGPVGVGVGVGPGWGYRDGYYGPGYRSYAYDGGYGYRRHCRLVREHFNGHVQNNSPLLVRML